MPERKPLTVLIPREELSHTLAARAWNATSRDFAPLVTRAACSRASIARLERFN